MDSKLINILQTVASTSVSNCGLGTRRACAVLSTLLVGGFDPNTIKELNIQWTPIGDDGEIFPVIRLRTHNKEITLSDTESGDL